MSEIVFNEVTKRFPDGTEAVKQMSLDIPDGEFVILVGPSGCGKSTALRMIAGLEDISEGELKIDDNVVNDLAPKDRDVAMVFQNYALYPHMTVRQNMAFPLKLAGVDQAEIDRKVSEAADTLDLTELLNRRPANLSGGQRQRVAMGRAIVRDPKAYLMDEPLSNLDAKLRVQMRTEVARIQQRLGTTTVYVTHDQTEAMTLGDRVAVMRAGLLQQVGKPTELYNNPTNLFVAGFIGSPAMNFVPGTIEDSKVKTAFGELPVPESVKAAGGGGREVIVGVRPEHLEDARVVDTQARDYGTTFKAKLDLLEALGAEWYAYFHLEGTRVESEHLTEVAADAGLEEIPSAQAGDTSLTARLNEMSEISEGDEIELWLDTRRLHLFDPQSGDSLAAAPSGDGARAEGGRAAEKPMGGAAG
ncbi:MAG TPA: sn-glycerol-3-phosphate ABC transporter ATP-binding protein UgpC [Solirubrobacterales bacterium]|nr:sn-glycerol-3-phosphate ABC transporter ATP-binding protein UgpC [Solirubrobacterales bacterium]